MAVGRADSADAVRPAAAASTERYVVIGVGLNVLPQDAAGLSLPPGSLQEVEPGLDAPTALLLPGLERLLQVRRVLGLRNSAHSLVKLLDPFRGEAVLVAPATHPDFIDLMRNIMQVRGQRGLLLRGTEGEPYANAKRRPRLEHVHDGVSDILFEAEHESLRTLPNLPEAADAASTARWIRRVLDKQIPLPKPIANQLACLLFASGYAEDFNQAKAIVAVEATGMLTGSN